MSVKESFIWILFLQTCTCAWTGTDLIPRPHY